MLAYLKRSRFYEFNWFTLTIFFRQTPRNNFHSESPRAPSWYTSPWGQRWRRRRRWGQTGCTGMHCCHLFPPVSLPLLVLAMLNYQLCSWKSGKNISSRFVKESKLPVNLLQHCLHHCAVVLNIAGHLFLRHFSPNLSLCFAEHYLLHINFLSILPLIILSVSFLCGRRLA